MSVQDGILLATGLHVHRSSAHSAGVGSIFDRCLFCPRHVHVCAYGCMHVCMHVGAWACVCVCVGGPAPRGHQLPAGFPWTWLTAVPAVVWLCVSVSDPLSTCGDALEVGAAAHPSPCPPYLLHWLEMGWVPEKCWSGSLPRPGLLTAVPASCAES